MARTVSAVCPKCAQAHWAVAHGSDKDGMVAICQECIDRKKTAAAESAKVSAYSAAMELAYGDSRCAVKLLDNSEQNVIRKLLADKLPGGMEEYWKLVEADVKR